MLPTYYPGIRSDELAEPYHAELFTTPMIVASVEGLNGAVGAAA